MRPSNSRLDWLEASLALLFALVLAAGLLRFGAAEAVGLYGLFLALSVPVVLAAVLLPAARQARGRLVALALVGLLVLSQVALRPSLEARGWTHLAVGWMALLLVFWILVSQPRLMRFFVLVLILLGAVEALFGLAQAIGGYDYIGDYFRGRGKVATGTLINRNHYAALLNMILPIALGALFGVYAGRRQRRESRTESLSLTWVVLLSCSLIGVAILLSLSRGGTVSLVSSLLLFALLVSLGRRSHRGRLPVTATWILLFTILSVGVAVGLDALLERFTRLDQGLSRAAVYRDSARLISDHPAFGIGPGMYRWRFRSYQSTDADLLYDHTHNDYLETAAEWGLPLAILGWSFVFWRFYRSARIFLTTGSHRLQSVALGCAVALFSILLHSLVDFSLQIPALLMIFATVLAMAWSLEFPVSPSRWSGTGSRARVVDLVVRTLVVAALLGACWQVTQRLRGASAVRPENGVAGLERAVMLDRSEPRYRHLLGRAYRDIPGAGELQTAERHLEVATRLNPYAWRYQLELAMARELLGKTTETEAALAEAVRLNPYSGSYRWRLANFRLRQGRIDTAVEEFAALIRLDSRLAEPAVALLLKTGVGDSALEAVWPMDRSSRVRLLRAMVTGRLDADRDPALEHAGFLEARWQELLADSDPPTLDEGRFYPQALLDQGQHDQARTSWLELAVRNDLVDPEFESGRNAIWNGGFDLPISGLPLGWHEGRSQAFATARTAGEGIDGSAAMQIEFHGTQNASFAPLSQELLLVSGAEYRLSVKLKAEGISTDEGPFLELLTPRGNQYLVTTEPVTGTVDWKGLEATFTMPEETQRAVLRLRRRPSRQLDSKIRGKVWIDSVTLERSLP